MNTIRIIATLLSDNCYGQPQENAFFAIVHIGIYVL